MRCWRVVAALLLGVASVLPIAVAAPASGATAAPARGWVVQGGVRFEPLGGADPPFTVGGVGTYRGAIEVKPGGHVVNDVALEDYVKGIAEIPTTWPAEALKAQAIAARTYALYEITTHVQRGEAPEICATQDCQVYAGYDKEARSPEWAAAAEATRGQLVLYKGLPILAMYSSSNGGTSVGGSQPYLRAAKDPDDAATAPVSYWRFALPLDAVGSAFGMPGQTFDVGRAGGAVVLTSRLDDGTQQQQTVALAAFRDRVNATIPSPNGLPRTIPSLRFTVFTNGDGVVIDGHGFGHGIGMSQFGALGKARRGMHAADILAAYYAGLRPVQLQPEQLPRTIRVDVADGRADTAVSSTRPFRVVAGDGSTIAPRATGAWHVVSAGGNKVRLVAPAGQDAPLALQLLGLDPRGARIRVNVPTDVQVTVSGQPMPSQVVDAGDHTLPLPPLPAGTTTTIVVAANAGAGRTAGVQQQLVVPDPSATTQPDDEPGDAPPATAVEALVAPVRAAATTEVRWPFALVAVLLAAAVGSAGGARYRSRRSRSS
jgi:stage II sporulation protein D